MEIFLECLPCLLTQTVKAAKMATKDLNIQKKIIDEVILKLGDYRNYCCTPDISTVIHRIVKDYSGISDPYKAVKMRDLEAAKKEYP